jgi:hypothetical protein
MGSYSQPSMRPGGELNLKWLMPLQSGLTPGRSRQFQNSFPGGPMSIEQLLGASQTLDAEQNSPTFGELPTASGKQPQSIFATQRDKQKNQQSGHQSNGSRQLPSFKAGGGGQPITDGQQYAHAMGVGQNAPINQMRNQLHQQYPQSDAIFPELFRAAVPLSNYLNGNSGFGNMNVYGGEGPSVGLNPFQQPNQNDPRYNDPTYLANKLTSRWI